jgi:hypothetical protein
MCVYVGRHPHEVTALSVIPRHDVPRNPSTSFGMPYRRDPLKRDVAPTMNDPVNVIMTQSVYQKVIRNVEMF